MSRSHTRSRRKQARRARIRELRKRRQFDKQ